MLHLHFHVLGVEEGERHLVATSTSRTADASASAGRNAGEEFARFGPANARWYG